MKYKSDVNSFKMEVLEKFEWHELVNYFNNSYKTINV